MLVGDLLDTVLNLLTFGFVAAMVWIYVRPPREDNEDRDDTM